MKMTRRTIAAAALAWPGVSAAQENGPPTWLAAHPAMSSWTRSGRSPERLLSARVDLESGERVRVRDYLGGTPTVLAVWATWCPPCLVEKPPMAFLDERLQAAGARTRVRALLAYDRADLAAARARLERLGAGVLENGRGLESVQTALGRLFNFDRQSGSMAGVSPSMQFMASVLPLTLLFSGEGELLGQHQGAMRLRPSSYWTDDATFDLMSRL